MIKELRIGNWVGTFKPHKVNAIYLSHFTAADESGLQHNSLQYNLLPIPLTPEILIAYGFKYGKVDGISSFEDSQNDQSGVTHYWDIRIKETKFVDSHSISLVKWGEQEYFTFQLERGFYRQKIKYLHQLQNLYFALTGTELEINLNP